MSGGLTIPGVETLVAELEKRRLEHLQAVIDKRGMYVQANPILSNLGDCDRQIAYTVTAPEAKPPITPELQARFDVGNLWESEMIQDLHKMKFDFQGGQHRIEVKGRGGVLLATGKIDGFIKWEGELIPVEFKSMHPNIFNQIDTIEDFQKKPWLRKYLRQLQMYCFGESKEYGLFGITDCLGKRKWFVLYLDLGECELLLQRLETVQKNLAAGTLPDRISFSDQTCGRCDFAQICLPDIMRNEAEILTDDDLIADLEERESLKDNAKRYGEIDKSVKARLKGIKKGVAGPFLIQSKPMPGRHQEAFDVEPYFITSIKKL